MTDDFWVDYSKHKIGKGVFFVKIFYIGKSISKFSYKAICSKLHTMLFYNKITETEGLDITEGIDVDCTGVESSKQSEICHFYFFKIRNFNFQPYICDGCHDAVLRAQAITNIKIIAIKCSTYRVVSNISFEESTRLLKLNNLEEKLGYL